MKPYRDPQSQADQYRWWEKSDKYTWGEVAMVLGLRAAIVVGVVVGGWLIIHTW